MPKVCWFLCASQYQIEAVILEKKKKIKTRETDYINRLYWMEIFFGDNYNVEEVKLEYELIDNERSRKL